MYFSKDGRIVYNMNNILWKRRLKSDWGFINLNLKFFNLFFKLSVYNGTNSVRSSMNIKAVLHEIVNAKIKFEKAYDDLYVRFFVII